ncbi:hypothetical protein C8Q74DRAFT_885191 [Fomes fomentarius]|nr:hypothetical protein C8Q74DRAFT_885191 [Fomes fomentarius]
MASDMDVDDGEQRWLDTVEGEVAFFRSLMRARPVGIHCHFHVLTMRNAILRDTGQLVQIEDLWNKLRTCYDLDILESIVSEPPALSPHTRALILHILCCACFLRSALSVPRVGSCMAFGICGGHGYRTQEAEGYDLPGDEPTGTPPLPLRSPSPSENLAVHPFFRGEYTLPQDETMENLVSTRRMRATASLPSSSPAPSPAAPAKSSRGGRKGKAKLKVMAGLVGGDSDSSALTQESGDESVAPTPRESVATGTDAGTEYAEDEEDPRQSPAASITSKQTTRKGAKGSRRGTGGARGRGASTAGSRGGKKKKK